MKRLGWAAFGAASTIAIGALWTAWWLHDLVNGD